MKKILFVDDDPRILSGLERMLFHLVGSWEMHFSTSGEEALELLEQKEFDLIVSDLRMPSMDGCTLLTEVKERWPHVVRVILSGQTETAKALRSVVVAHQFLSKPCDPNRLEEVIRRTCSLRDMLYKKTLQEAIGKIDTLPLRPRLYQELVKLLQDPEVSFESLARLIKTDVSVSSKVLRMVNSAFIGLAQQINSVRDAVAYLGTTMIKNLVLTAELFRTPKNPQSTRLDMEWEQSHALRVGAIAELLLSDTKESSEEAFTAGLLHDVGKIVMAVSMPEEFGRTLDLTDKEGLSYCEIEQDLYGASHAEIGAYFLGVWGLPYSIVEAVAFHHKPVLAAQPDLELSDVVSISNRLAHEIEVAMNNPYGVEHAVSIDPELFDRPDLKDQLTRWRAMVQEKFCSDNSESYP